MSAVKPSRSKSRRRLHLAAGAEGHLQLVQNWGWSISARDNSGGILLADLAHDAARAMDAIRAHEGPVVAVMGADQSGDFAQYLAAGVTHFAPAGDSMLLCAALEAAAAQVGGSRRGGGRRGDQSANKLFDWLVEVADRDDEATLLLIDLGAIEHVNAAHSRATGDLLLLRASRRLATFSRRIELTGAPLIRIAGQRYCLAVPQLLVPDRIDFLLTELLAKLARPYAEEGNEIHLPAAVAAATRKPGETASRCLSRAQSLLDRAKGQSPAVATEARGKQALPRYDEHQIEKDLRHAVGRGEIEIVYQPQFAFVDDRIVGAEALARWNHDQYGPLGAGVLFSVAARSDYLVPLSHYIQERAMGEAARWRGAAASLRLSLNVTPQDLAQPKFKDGFLAKLEASGLDPARLTIEITETGLMRDVEANARILGQLRVRGIAVAVDDFGTGYSSLAWLKDLPLDAMKLDQGLTADIMTQDRGRIIVQSVIAMGRALGLKIVAEGVETEEQRALLAAEGCDVFQGFLRAPPLSAADFAAFVEREA